VSRPQREHDSDRPLAGKTVVLGVTGSIAAYKAAEIIRRLTELGAEVHVTATRGGLEFVTPVTLRTLSGNPVVTDMFADPTEWEIKHVSLAQRADAVLVAPASANAIAKLAHGLADEFLYAVALAARGPLLVAPAMNTWMYEHPATQANLALLRSRGAHIIEAEAGWLACREAGRGRLADPECIAAAVVEVLVKGDLKGVRLLVTAGPTREPLDPVRFISNRSSGKMGYVLAEAAAGRGAQVTLVSGPTALPDPIGCQVLRVTTAAEMREAVLAQFPSCDVVIAVAAPADYAPAAPAKQKIRRTKKPLTIALQPTADIIAECGRTKRAGQLVVAFAAETQDLLAQAQKKLKAKRADLLVANDVSRPDVGLEADRNAGYLLFADGRQQELPELEKRGFAERILDAIVGLIAARPT
jgi:phosphopantothenoylcysteine decarboxylase/phosphopantothenate--cysteine ligase